MNTTIIVLWLIDSSVSSQDIEQSIKRIPGVMRIKTNKDEPRLILVDYNRVLTNSADILHAVRLESPNTYIVGM